MVRFEFPLLILDGEFDRDIEHDILGKIVSGTLSREYYWLDRWYNVFRFTDPNQKLQSFYCNITVPPKLDGEILSYIDLDIDVLVQPDFTYKVLDLDDFEKHAQLYKYPEDLKINTRRALKELIELIETRAFPFN